MFIFKPKTAEDLQRGMFILSYYKVHIEVFSDGENSNSVEVHVDGNDEWNHGRTKGYPECEQNYRDCEATFQANFRQEGSNLCHVCREQVEGYDDGESSCGHLVFTSHIGNNLGGAS